MSFRTIAAGASMLAAFTLATGATAAAQVAASKSSAASAQTRVAKPVRATKPQRETSRARHGKRTRVASRHRRRAAPEAAAESIRRPTARAESAGVVHQQTTAARRFREFLNPQSFAQTANEELRSPRLLAAHFSGEIADPENQLAEAAEPVAADPPTGAPPIVARDQPAVEESPNKAPALTQSVQVEGAAPRGKPSDGMSFLRWFFVAWGGVLTFASAVRMAVG